MGKCEYSSFISFIMMYNDVTYFYKNWDNAPWDKNIQIWKETW